MAAEVAGTSRTEWMRVGGSGEEGAEKTVSERFEGSEQGIEFRRCGADEARLRKPLMSSPGTLPNASDRTPCLTCADIRTSSSSILEQAGRDSLARA